MVKVLKWRNKAKLSVALTLSIWIIALISYQYGLSSVPAAGPYYLDVPFGDASYYVGKFDNGTTYMVDGDTWQCPFWSTDSSVVINAVLGNLTSGRTWKETVFLKGQFTLGSDPTITLDDYVILDGDAELILPDSCQDDSIIRAISKSHIEIRNIKINGNKANQGATLGHNGIYFENCTDIRIVNVEVTGINEQTSPDNAQGRGIWLNWCNNTRIADSTISWCEKTGIETHECYDWWVQGCTLEDIDENDNGGFLSIQDHAIAPDYDPSLRGHIINNDFLNNSASGHPFLSINNSSYIEISGNTFNQSVGYDIRLGRCSTSPYSYCDYSIVSNNIFINGYGIQMDGDFNQIKDNIFTDSYYGVVLWNNSDYTPEHNQIVDNTFENNENYAVYFFAGGGHNNTIRGNNIINPQDEAICFATSGNSDDNTIYGNTFREVASGKYCVWIGSGSYDDNVFKYNDFRYNAGTIYDADGTSTIQYNDGFITENSGAVVSCYNGSWIPHGLAGDPATTGSITLSLRGTTNYNATWILRAPTVLQSNSTHFQIEFTAWETAGWTRVPVTVVEAQTVYWDATYKP